MTKKKLIIYLVIAVLLIGGACFGIIKFLRWQSTRPLDAEKITKIRLDSALFERDSIDAVSSQFVSIIRDEEYGPSVKVTINMDDVYYWETISDECWKEVSKAVAEYAPLVAAVPEPNYDLPEPVPLVGVYYFEVDLGEKKTIKYNGTDQHPEEYNTFVNHIIDLIRADLD